MEGLLPHHRAGAPSPPHTTFCTMGTLLPELWGKAMVF